MFQYLAQHNNNNNKPGLVAMNKGSKETRRVGTTKTVLPYVSFRSQDSQNLNNASNEMEENQKPESLPCFLFSV